jgi:hypothetical protein
MTMSCGGRSHIARRYRCTGEVGRWRVCIATDRYSGQRRDKVGE